MRVRIARRSSHATTTEWLSAREAATRLGISDRTLRTWVKRRIISAQRAKRSRRVLFHADEVQRLVVDRRDDREQGPTLGRERELSRIERQLRTKGAWVCITGPPGIGKTRVARDLARRRRAAMQRRGDAHVAFCDLRQVARSDDVLIVVALALGVPVLDSDASVTLHERIARWLAERPDVLLVLDNAEDVVAHVCSAIVAWRMAQPALRVLMTSRLTASHAGCSEELLGPLDDEASRLLVRRLTLERPLEDAVVNAIVHDAGGLPLALELEATQRKRRALAPRRRAAIDPLHAALDQSWKSLSAAQARVLAACSLFVGPFTRAAAAEVVGASQRAVVALFGQLVQRGLIRPFEALPEPRFTLLEPIRQFAFERLERSGARARVQRSYARWCVAFGEREAARVDSRDGGAALDALEAERRNLERCCREPIDHELALRAVVALDALLEVRGPSAGRIARLREVLARAKSVDAGLACMGFVALASAERIHGSRQAGLEAAERATRIAARIVKKKQSETRRVSVDAARLAWTEYALHLVFAQRLAEAESAAAMAAKRALRLREHDATRWTLDGLTIQRRGDSERGAELLARAASAFHADGKPISEAKAQFRAGMAWVGTDAAKAHTALLASAALWRSIGASWWHAFADACRSMTLAHDGRLSSARDVARDALRTLVPAQHAAGILIAESTLASIAIRELEPSAARAHLEHALPRALEQGDVVAALSLQSASMWLPALAGDRAGFERSREQALRSMVPSTHPGWDAFHITSSTCEVLLSLPSRPPTEAIALLRSRDAELARSPTQHVNAALAQRVAGELVARALVEHGGADGLVVGIEGAWFWLRETGFVDLSNRPTASRVLYVLARARVSGSLHADGALLGEELVRAAWPGEVIAPRAAWNRLWVQLSELRKRGLRCIVRGQSAYRIDEALPVRLAAGRTIAQILRGPRTRSSHQRKQPHAALGTNAY